MWILSISNTTTPQTGGTVFTKAIRYGGVACLNISIGDLIRLPLEVYCPK